MEKDQVSVLTLGEAPDDDLVTGDAESDLALYVFVHELCRTLKPRDVRLLLQVLQRLDVEPGRHSEAEVQRDWDDRGSGADHLSGSITILPTAAQSP